jgi:hypothetical protein
MAINVIVHQFDYKTIKSVSLEALRGKPIELPQKSMRN